MSNLTGTLQVVPNVPLTGAFAGAAPPAPVPEAVPAPESPQEPSVPVGEGELSQAAHKHVQSTPASEWLVPNPWGVMAASILVMVGGQVVNTTITENSAQHVALRFPSPTSGLVLITKGA